MATALKTWAKVRAPVLCITGTGSGVGIPLARGGRISTPAPVPGDPPIIADTYNIVYEGPIFLGDQQTMMRTDFNPSTITGTVGSPQSVRSPYFTANSPSFTFRPGSFVEWQAMGPLVVGHSLTLDQEEELIGELVTTDSTFFNMTADAFAEGQYYSPSGSFVVSITKLTEV
jgi:hypothetical protein